MGGSGSGYRGHRPTIEGATQLTVRKFNHAGALVPGARGEASWAGTDGESWSAEFRVTDSEFILSYRVWDESDHSAIPWERQIPYVRTPCRYGGTRPYWLCPFCRRRFEVLVMTTNGRTWACRKCLRVCYVSQTLGRGDRLQRRAERIYNSLGGEHEDGLVYKPKGMRWRTFNRRIDRANELSEAADELFALRVYRLFGGGMATS